MNTYKEVKEVVESLRNQPKKTSLIIFVMFFLVISVAYLSGFFSEKGKKHADYVKNNSSLSREVVQNVTSAKIQQDTKGNQSPAIVSGAVNINFESDPEQEDSTK